MDLPSQARDAPFVGGVNALLTADFVEGAVGGEDDVDAAVECDGGEDRVAGVEARIRFEQVDGVIGYDYSTFGI